MGAAEGDATTPQVWVEKDNDGLFKDTDTYRGQHGVTVELYRFGEFYRTTTTGPSGDYRNGYHGNTLNALARRIRVWLKEGKDVYAYFNNDYQAQAAKKNSAAATRSPTAVRVNSPS